MNKKSVGVAEFFAVVSLSAYVIAAAFFLFKMKDLGFSLPELGVMAAAILLIAFSFGDLIIHVKTAPSTRILSSIVVMLVTVILVLAMTLFVPWIQKFFVL
ncbi:MAG: hypothetical protein IIY44_05165 [Erysipelotrichales bacterium]|nr:hypothetical protein [Erysipelotrichales bacterium]MBQ1385824.1 hypothetical protein [Erysipelotrichales bacterium]MBQ2309330.1 hypothetical protein [Erysipelotrichales bacterium]MBQ4011876.1 hypothetical protein [Erysipelotrichales bacterium]MBQ4374288.1 hypothetical protein [Erysipelotrichales bacterium]